MDYIKLSRKILEWEWYSDVNTCRLFIHMLLKANWKDGRFQGEEILRGSFVSSYQNLSSETGLSVKNVRTALEHLKSTGEVAVNRHPKYSVFTIKNYCQYQSTGSQPAVNRQSTGSQPATIEEGKKERKEEYNSITDVMLSDQQPKPKENSHIYATIRELYNSVCGSYPRLVKMTEARKKAIHARLRKYTLDDFKTLFEKAEASDFLKGSNNRNWSADFDWLINESNMTKTLEGKYDNNKKGVKGNGSAGKAGKSKDYIQEFIDSGGDVDFTGF